LAREHKAIAESLGRSYLSLADINACLRIIEKYEKRKLMLYKMNDKSNVYNGPESIRGLVNLFEAHRRNKKLKGMVKPEDYIKNGW
jgi:hypothetical protein